MVNNETQKAETIRQCRSSATPSAMLVLKLQIFNLCVCQCLSGDLVGFSLSVVTLVVWDPGPGECCVLICDREFRRAVPRVVDLGFLLHDEDILLLLLLIVVQSHNGGMEVEPKLLKDTVCLLAYHLVS